MIARQASHLPHVKDFVVGSSRWQQGGVMRNGLCVTLGLTSTLAACSPSQEPRPQPESHIPPTDAEAKIAYVRAATAIAMQVDLTGELPPSPSKLRPLFDQPAPPATSESDKGGFMRQVVKRNYDKLKSVAVNACAWQQNDYREGDMALQPASKVQDGFVCAVELIYSTPAGQTVRENGDGFFYRSGGQFLYAGPETNELMTARRRMYELRGIKVDAAGRPLPS